MSQVTTHSTLSPSAAHRWLECTGSIELISKYGVPVCTSEYAARGNRIHEWAAWLLSHPNPMQGYGELIESAKSNADVLGIEEAKNYVDYVLSYYNEGDIIEVEHQVSLNDLYPEMKGYVDSFIVKKERNEVHIFDLKTGFVPVTARNNPQLLLYAYGVLKNYTDLSSIKNVVLHIIQGKQNFDFTNMSTVSKITLLSFVDTVKNVIQNISDGNYTYKEGDHCKYCPVVSRCKKVFKSMENVCNEIENLDFESESIDNLSKLVYNYIKYEGAIERCKERIKEHLEQGGSSDYFTLQVRKATKQNWSIEEHRIFATLYEQFPFFFDLLQNEDEDVTPFFNIKLPPIASIKRALYDRRDLEKDEIERIISYLEECRIPEDEVEKYTILKRIT